MKLPKQALLALCILAVPGIASAQGTQYENPKDLKPLVPPIVPLPPNSKLSTGTVGGYQSPSNTTAPLLGNPDFSQSTNQPAPGLRLTIPSR
jgi:hypothetical protein